MCALLDKSLVVGICRKATTSLPEGKTSLSHLRQSRSHDKKNTNILTFTDRLFYNVGTERILNLLSEALSVNQRFGIPGTQ